MDEPKNFAYNKRAWKTKMMKRYHRQPDRMDRMPQWRDNRMIRTISGRK